jgi:hypothetical protein
MTWLRVRTAVLLAVLAAAVSLTAADLPWVGQWKINVAKSNFGEETTTYADVGAGEIEVTFEGRTWKFKMDGKDYADPLGGTSAWRQMDASSWETVNKLKGKVLSTEVSRLSADGKTLTVVAKGTRPNGRAFENTYELTRLSGGPGLPGKWKTSKVTLSGPSLIEITPFETDGLTLRIVDTGATWSAKFDGKDNPVKGVNIVDGLTIALERTGPTSLGFVQKQNGKETFKGTLTVSADGKAMTSTGSAAGTNERTTAVYDRQ